MGVKSDLVIGTAQFGLAYGITGRATPVAESEVRRILELAAEAGVRRLDTAPVYGDIERRLVGLLAGLDFKICSKIGEIPGDVSGQAAVDWTVKQAKTSFERADGRLDRLLWHRVSDLKRPEAGDGVAAVREALGPGVSLGASYYVPEDLAALSHLPLTAAQVPGNAFDRRFVGLSGTLLIDVRSVFLQGVLLASSETIEARLPSLAVPLKRWHAWLSETGLTPVAAALSIARYLFPGAGIVVGMDSARQLKETLDACALDPVSPAPGLEVHDEAVLRPDLWPKPIS